MSKNKNKKHRYLVYLKSNFSCVYCNLKFSVPKDWNKKDAIHNGEMFLEIDHIIPLSKFFDRSLHIRTALKQIINTETKPLSDNEIAKVLKEQGFKVARRTVAKYRSMEGILPSHLRQNQMHPEVT